LRILQSVTILIFANLVATSTFAAQSLVTALDQYRQNPPKETQVMAVTLDSPGITADAPPPETLAIENSASQLIYMMEQEKKSNVYAWEMEDHKGYPHYCYQECACMAALNERMLDAKKIPHGVIVLKSPPGNLLGLTMLRSWQPRRELDYSYHVATLALIKDHWYVIDPIVTGSTRLEDLAVWVTRIVDAPQVIAELSLFPVH
jgi:hypothetical protein